MSIPTMLLEIIEKQAVGPIIQQLLDAKGRSDIKDYKGKHQRLRSLIEQYPDDFYIDSQDGDIVGITHKSGFRIHAPLKILPVPLRRVKDVNPDSIG